MNRRVFALSVVSAAAAVPQTDPQRTMWLNIKRKLNGPDADAYFKESIENAQLPPLTGAVISSLLNDGISKLEIGIEGEELPDATLIVHHAFHRIKEPLKRGTQVTFSGVAVSFTKQPLVLTFDVPSRDIEGVQFVPLRQ